MAKNLIADGDNVTFVAQADHKSGDLVRVGNALVCVVIADANIGLEATGALTGVWQLPIASGATSNAVALGAKVGEKNGEVTNHDTSGAVVFGKAVSAPASGFVNVRLSN